MIIAKLSIRYERGLHYNNEKDLVAKPSHHVLAPGSETQDGKYIRGLGTHFEDKATMELVQARDKSAAWVRGEFKKKFLATIIDGCYFVEAKGVAKEFINSVRVDERFRDDIRVSVVEFALTSESGLDPQELEDWAKRIKGQLANISLGRSKEADEEGLRALVTLASSPLLKKETGDKLKGLVELVRTEKMSRVEIKRAIETLDVKIEENTLSPRRGPALLPRRNPGLGVA